MPPGFGREWDLSKVAKKKVLTFRIEKLPNPIYIYKTLQALYYGQSDLEIHLLRLTAYLFYLCDYKRKINT